MDRQRYKERVKDKEEKRQRKKFDFFHQKERKL